MKKESKEIRTEIVINASPPKVWEILTDFQKYAAWNPLIKSIKGTLEEGKKITARIEPPGASGMTFTPTLLVVKPQQELRWLGHLFVPGLFDGEHIFELYENTDGSTTFVQRELFRGILVPLFSKMLDTNTPLGFDMMNRKLKSVAEGNSNIPSSPVSNRSPFVYMSLIILFSLSVFFARAQNKLTGQELSINFFRNPSIGAEFRWNHVSFHAGYYPTNFESGVTTSFIRTGATYWFLPFGNQPQPSSFYGSASYVRGLDRDYEDKNGVMAETGVRWTIWKGLNLRLGVAALFSSDRDVEINPTPGVSYSFLLK